MVIHIAEAIQKITDKLRIPYIFKASYRKANRSRIDSFTGIGDEKALTAIKKAGDALQVPALTDIHTEEEAVLAAKYVDVLQIPAFLCRQTELLAAAAKTGKHINIKKGQFLSPGAMQFAIQKVKDSGNNNILITERGTMFGYNDMVGDEVRRVGRERRGHKGHPQEPPRQPPPGEEELMAALTGAARHRQANRDADGAVQQEHDPIEGVEFHGPL